MAVLDGPFRPPKAGGEADSLVIVLHGRGANGEGLIGLAEHLAGAFPAAAFYAPDAPYDFEAGPHGRQWYPSSTPELRRQGLLRVTPTVNEYLDEMLAYHRVAPSRCVLVGFSKGLWSRSICLCGGNRPWQGW